MPILCRYAGTPGVSIVVRENDTAQWRVEGTPEPESDPVEVGDEADVATGSKRTRTEDKVEEGDAKRARVSEDASALDANNPAPASKSPCLAPPPNAIATDIMRRRTNADLSLGAGDVFLTDGWRERWCHCSSVRLLYAAHQ